MANYLEIYFVKLKTMIEAPEPEGHGGTFLERAKREIARARSRQDGSDYQDITRWMRHVAPGLEFVENMGRIMFVTEDVETIAQGLPEPLRSRFAVGPREGGAGFPPDLPRSSPLRVLDLPGWQFFNREEMEAFRREYEKLDEDLLLNPEDEEWDNVFAAHDEDQEYDFALFWREGH